MVERKPQIPKKSLLFCAILTLLGIGFANCMWEMRGRSGLDVALPILGITSLTSIFGQFVLIPSAILTLRRGAESGDAEDFAILAFAQMVYPLGLIALCFAADGLYGLF